MHNFLNNTSDYNSTKYLFQRLEDMLACHHQMEVLKILFENVKGSWLAIHLAHKVVKDEVAET